MKQGKKPMKVIGIVLLVLCALPALIYLNHRIRSAGEAGLLTPLGELVEVDGHNMSVYVEGEGSKTLVFLSGAGTCSPILDFRSLSSLLADDYKIAVVEKFGYGFSDIVDRPGDIDVMLSQTRTALRGAGVEGPYTLCPHSMSGLEALRWAQTYPDEVEAIVGLDMAVPGHYEDMSVSMPLIRLGGWAAGIGATRLIPGLSESDAVKYGTLTDREKEIYRAVFYQRTGTVTMLREAAAVKDNAKAVEAGGVPQVPMLLFLSDGSGGTGFSADAWRRPSWDYLTQVEDGSYIELDCPHYVHDHEYERIAREIKAWLSGLD